MTGLGKTLVIAGGGIGDVLFLTALFKAVAAKTGDGRLSVASKRPQEIEQLYKYEPWFEQSISVRDTNKIKDFFKCVRFVRKQKFDTAINLHRSETLQLIPFAAGVKNRYGPVKGDIRPLARLFVNRPLELPPERYDDPMYKHRWCFNWLPRHANRVIDAMGVPYEFIAKEINYPHASGSEWDALPGPFTAIGINTADRGRQWGGANYARLINAINNSIGGTFILFGASDVLDEAQIITSYASYDRPVSLVSLPERGTSVEESVKALALCERYVGNDSFGANIAALMGIPSYTMIIGVGNIFHYSPSLHPIYMEKRDGIPELSELGIVE